MKIKRILVAMLLLVLVCTLFVACNDDNGGEQLTRKPWAKSDPNNQYDLLSDSQRIDYSIMDFDGEYIVVILTNSESLNNLFYDYKVEDFGENWFKEAEVLDAVSADKLARIRKQIKNSIAYDSNDPQMIDPGTYTREVKLYLKEPGKENALRYGAELLKNDYVRNVEPDTIGGVWFGTTSSDPQIADQWGLEKIKAFDAWDITTGSSRVTVGHIDSGISRSHEDLASNVSTTGYSDERENPFSDTANHGTRTAGVIGAVGNNGKGVSGVCWNVNIVSLKSCFGSRTEDAQLVINALEYAKNNNIKLLNFSGGFYESAEFDNKYKEPLRSAIQSYNGLIVVAAGNSGYNIVNENASGIKLYPQSFELDNVLVVGATARDDTAWNNSDGVSNYGKSVVDLFAPGVDIQTTSAASEKAYGQVTGTSLAAPFVTGVAALMLSIEPNLTAEQLKSRIMSTVDPVPALSNLCVSGGRLNAKKAVEAHGHNLTTCTYTSNGVRRGHSVSCDFCSYTDTEVHNWCPVKVPKTEIVEYHICTKCLEKTEIIEIPHPSSLLAPNVLALINEKESVTSGDFDIEITKDVAIVKKDGKYYLMIACDDNGNPIADLSRVIRKDEVI